MRPALSTLTLREPRTLRDALRMLRDEGPLTPLAGCTDVFVQINFGTLRATAFLDLSRLAPLRRIREEDGRLVIGALATYTDLIRSRFVRRRLPMLVAAAREVGGPQIQHRGTLKQVPAEGLGTLPLFGLTAKFEKTPGDITAPPPRLSAHTAEVLAGVGVTPEELAALQSKGIV